MKYLRKLLENWMGMDALRLEITHLQYHSEVRAQEDARLSEANRRLVQQLDEAAFLHTQDQAAIAMVAGQRWGAVSALVGGVEQLQHKWQGENPPRHGRGLGPEGISGKLTAKHVNELGGLKRSIQRQFGVHPSQAKKSAAEVLGHAPMGRLTQQPTPAPRHATATRIGPGPGPEFFDKGTTYGEEP